MNTISIGSLWHFFKWFAIIMVLDAVLQAGVPLSVICSLLLVRFALRLIFQLIGGVFKIAKILRGIILREAKMSAYNKRFGASGGVTSNDLLWGI